MTNQRISLDRWSDVAITALKSVSESSLSLATSAGVLAVRPADPSLWGSLISLVSGHNSTCVGLSSTPAGCRTIAGAMLGMDASDAEELSHDEVRDSVGELVNMLVGAMKTELAPVDSELGLGLPLFVEGVYEGDSRSEGRYLACQLGDVPCVLTILLAASERCAAA